MPPAADVDLSGTWRAAPAGDEVLRAGYVDPALDDAGWEPLRVPGHWRSSAAFADHDGPVLYRTRFETVRADAGRRSFLVLDGVLAASDVWLDGSYLGDTSGYVVPHAFEITDLLAARSEHLLAMEVSCSPVGAGATRDLTGALGRSALLGDGHNPGGIWRPVTVHHTGPVRLRYSRLRCPQADDRRARLALRAVLDSLEATSVTLRTSVRPVVAADGRPLPTTGDAPLVVEREQPLATGENRVEWEVAVPDPDLWWPHALGGQPRYEVRVEVLVDDEVSDGRTWCTGIRQVRLDDFTCRVNGERLFLKGVSTGPTRLLLADAAPEEVAADVQRVADAGLDLLRVHGHVGRPELYEAADAAGVLVWQDLPVQWGVQRAAKAPARRLARAVVDRLAHHPSVALWCAHHEPWDAAPASWRDGDEAAARRRRRRTALAQALPSWNRSVLDRSVALALEHSDGSRPVVPHAGVWPHVPQLAGTSTHLWAGWRWGSIGDLPRLLRWWPRTGRFVGEFGAQAPGPDLAELDALVADASPGRTWPDLDWPAVARATGLELGPALRTADPADHPDPASWATALQAHQSDAVASHVEALRRLKHRPTGGFTAFALADPAPGITAALLDHRRRPKPAWEALVAACAPVLAVVDRPPDRLAPLDHLHLEVHLVNDDRVPRDGLRVTVESRWTLAVAAANGNGAGARTDRQAWVGDVPPDDVVRVGTVHLDVPADAVGLDLAVRLEGPAGRLGERVHHRRIAPH